MVCNSYLPRSPRSAIGNFGKIPDFSGSRRRSKRATPKGNGIELGMGNTKSAKEGTQKAQTYQWFSLRFLCSFLCAFCVPPHHPLDLMPLSLKRGVKLITKLARQNSPCNNFFTMTQLPN